MKNRFVLFAAALSCVLLAGCQLNPFRSAEKKPEKSAVASTAGQPAAVASTPENPARTASSFPLASGTYRCEQNEVLRIVRDQELPQKHLQIDWNQKQYVLLRVHSTGSGLPRFSDVKNGLEWIDLPWKGVLLNSHTQKPIASECKIMTAAQLAVHEQQEAQRLAKQKKGKKKKAVRKKRRK